MSVTIRITLMATLFAALGTPAAAVPIDWVGPGGDYSDSTKWGGPVPGGPCNSMFIDYEVNIPVGGKVVNQDVASCTVNTFTLGDGNNMTLSPGSGFRVTGQASLAGIIDGIGGNFTTLGPVIFAGERARAYAAAGSQVLIRALSYSSKRLVFSDGGCCTDIYTTELFKATNPGSLLDLSSMQSIDAGFGPQGNDNNRHEIVLSDDATLDLSHLGSVLSPQGYNDWIRFSLTGAASQLRLGALSTLTSAGRGRTLFQLQGGASLELPALATANDAVFDVGDGSVLQIGTALTQLYNARFTVAGGGQVTESSAASTYSSKGLVFTDGPLYAFLPYTTELFKATNPGSLLDLSSVQSIDAGFGSQGNDNNQEIIVSDGATLDLSHLGSVLSPQAWGDWIRFSLTGTASQLRLGALSALTSAGRGRTLFQLRGGASLELSALATANDAEFDVGDGSVLHIGAALSQLSNTRFTVAGGAQATESGAASAYSSKGLVFGSTWGGATHTSELFRATNPGSLLDLSSIQSIDAGFAQQNDYNRHEISCTDGAILDLSGVRTITSPVGSGDWLRFSASSGCTIKLNSLQKITSAGAGPVKFAISGGGKIEAMAPVTVSATTEFLVGTDSSLRFAGGELGGTGSRIELQGATASLLIDDDLILEDGTSFLLAPGSLAEFKSSLFFKQVVKTSADRAKVKMSQATVKLSGGFPKVQILEAAGADVLPQLPADDNFGIGQLVLAGDEQGNPSLAAVVDRFNNGQRDPSQTCSSTEVLYLFGLSDGQGGRSDGLVLENGSTLFLDDAVKVYAWSEEARLAGGNPVVLLNEILGSEPSVPYSGGFLAHDLSDRDGDGISDLADNCPDTPNGADLGPLRQADADCNAKGDACECGDFNKNGTVNTIDARAIQKWVVAPGPVPPMFCDTNGDGRCNTIDARRVQRKVVGELDPDELLCRPYYPCPRFGGTCLP